MQNQGNNNYLEALSDCRKEIDAIDDKILKLLQDRVKIVEKVKEIKNGNGEDFFIKSAREADMINSLISRAGEVNKEIVIAIWRKIITSSNVFEQPIKISLHNPREVLDYQYLIKQYYADFVPIISHKSIEKVICDLENDRAQIAVFALPNHENEDAENWWINLANAKNGLKIFAKIPFDYQNSEVNLVALARKKPEKSAHDASLLCVEVDAKFDNLAVISEFKKAGFAAKILKKTKLPTVSDIAFFLLEVDGYYDEEDFAAMKKSVLKPFVKMLGVCPVVKS